MTLNRIRPALRPVAVAAAFINVSVHLALALAHPVEMPYIGALARQPRRLPRAHLAHRGNTVHRLRRRIRHFLVRRPSF